MATPSLSSLGRLVRSPLATLLTLLVIALALALPTGLKLFVSNAHAGDRRIRERDRPLGLSEDRRAARRRRSSSPTAREQRSDVAQVTLIPADQALEEFRNYSGFGAALEALEDNPLPHVLHVRPKSETASPATLESLRKYFMAWPEVDLVQIDSEWVMRFTAILDLLRRMLLICVHRAGRRRAGGDRQHHPARDPQPARRDRSHQARRRLERVRAAAVPLHRNALRARRRVARVGDHLSASVGCAFGARQRLWRSSMAASSCWRG